MRTKTVKPVFIGRYPSLAIAERAAKLFDKQTFWSFESFIYPYMGGFTLTVGSSRKCNSQAEFLRDLIAFLAFTALQSTEVSA